MPILNLLKGNRPYSVNFIFRDIGTREEFDYYLGKWVQKKFAQYPILYLAFHGDPDLIHIGEKVGGGKESVSLRDLADTLEGRCKGRIIFFSSCSTLNVHGNCLNALLRRTQALAICGYSSDVDWITSAAFELVVLSSMQLNAFTVAGAKAMRARIKREMPHMVTKLRFKMVIRKPA